MGLYYTTVRFFDNQEIEYEADVIYYVDTCIDTNAQFIDDFEIKHIECLDPEHITKNVNKKDAYFDFYDIIMNAIVDKPGEKIKGWD